MISIQTTNGHARSRWNPILSGALQREAMAAIGAIDSDLERIVRAPLPPDPVRPLRCIESSLMEGLPGIAIWRVYGERARVIAPGRTPAIRLLERASSLGAPDPTLVSGWCGIGWALEHLAEHSDVELADDALRELDDLLSMSLLRERWRGSYDLYKGLAGVGVYLLERPSPRRQALLDRVLELFSMAHAATDGGCFWRSPDAANAGTAHGAVGIIGFLARVGAAGRAEPSTARVIAATVDWLLAQRSAHDNHALAWCNGDLAAAVVLLAAGRAFGRDDWVKRALALGRLASMRSTEAARVRDAGLCHGAAGVGHLFNRLYQATGEETFATAARSWFARALDMRRAAAGIGGFVASLMVGDGLRPYADPGLLTGAAGIALALLSAAAPVEPKWDRLFLIDVATQEL